MANPPSLEPRYTTRFLAKAHRYTPTSAERSEARASLDQLKVLLPADIVPEDDIDIVYFVGNLACPGLANANDDSVTWEDGIALAKGFERRQCNIEHNRKQIVGYIVKAGFSQFGSNALLSEDEVRAAKVPFNIVIVVAVWKVADKGLAEFIQEMGAPGSPDKDTLSLSFEVGFSSYDIAVLPVGVTDLSQAVKVVTAPSAATYPDRASANKALAAFQRYDDLLRVNKGSGVTRAGERVVRVLSGDLIPLGAGVVTVPAAQVKGIEPISTNPGAPVAAQGEGNGYEYSSTQFTLDAADAKPFQDYGAAIPEDHLYYDTSHAGHSYGRENEAHVTLLYGIKDDSHEAVATAIAPFHAPTLTFGAVSVFSNQDKPYDVLKVDVDGGQHLQDMYHAVKAGTENHTEWLDYHAHATICYLKKGTAQHYVGDACFAGLQIVPSHLTFSPRSGAKVHLPLKADPNQVYTSATHLSPMTIKANRIKIPAGLAEKAKGLNYPKADVTLSDGRVLKGVTVFSGDELDLDASLNDLQGVVITDMTPSMPPGIDDATNIHPHVDDTFPTKTPEARVEDAAQEEIKHVLQNMPYTDAIVKALETAAKALQIIEAKSGVSDSVATPLHTEATASTHPMKLEDLKQLEAKVKSATKPEEVSEAFAQLSLFAQEIMKASEQYSAAAEKAKQDKIDAETASATLKADLAAAKTTLAEMKAAQSAATAEASFNDRMSAVAELFDLDDEVRAFVAEEVRACADDESFAKYLTKAKKMMKGALKSKNTKTADDEHGSKGKGQEGKHAPDDASSTEAAKKDDDKDDDDDKDEAKAALASAAANPTDKLDLDLIGNPPSKLTLAEQYASAFARDVSIGGKSLKDLTSKKKS